VVAIALKKYYIFLPFHNYQQTFVAAIGIFIHILDLDYVPAI